MKFSVVIPLYNKRRYISRCLQSVCAQTHTDFDVIVVNDGSTDGGEREVETCSDERLRLVSQQNQGVSVARNVGVSLAQTDIVFFLDADDTWEPTFLEEISRLVAAFPAAGVYACGTRKWFADGHSEACTVNAPTLAFDAALLDNYFQVFVDLGQSPFSNSSFGVRKAAFARAGAYTPGVKLTEDSDLWVRLSLSTPVAFMPKPLANYHVEVADNTRLQRQTADYEVVKTLQRLLRTGAIPVALRRSAARLLVMQKHSQIKRLILLGEPRAAWRRLFDRDLWQAGAAQSALLALAASVPPSVFSRFRQLMLRRR